MRRKIIGQATTRIVIAVIIAAAVAASVTYVAKPTGKPTGELKEKKKQFEGMKIYWIGGASGDPFDALLMKGALEAEKYLGVDVEYVHTEWRPDITAARFSDAIAARPDGIVVIGISGYEALKDLFEEAHNKGIYATFSTVDIPRLRESYSDTGYVGQRVYEAGQTIARAAIERFHPAEGDRAAVFSGCWDEPPRAQRAIGAEDALLEAGMVVDRVEHASEAYGDPSMLIPVVTGYYSDHPDVKLIVFDGGGSTAATTTLMQSIGVDPGQIKVIGFDLCPATGESIHEGYLQLTLDQQPYLQGYMTVLNLCLSKKYGFSGLFMDTGGGIVGAHNIDPVLEFIEAGYR